MAQLDYYALPRDKRWMESDNPHSIGGRDTAIEQIALSLELRIKSSPFVRSVSAETQEKIDRLKHILAESADLIQEIISDVSDSVLA